MGLMSEGYAGTLGSLDAGKAEEASRLFKRRCVQAVKKLYAEAAETYPVRFSGAEDYDWCAWTRQLYVLTRRIEDALEQGRLDEAIERLPGLREHFYGLHVEAKTLKANDHIYAYLRELLDDAPSLDDLVEIQEFLSKAEPSAKALAEGEAYERAKSRWTEAVGVIVDDGAIDSAELPALREASQRFYEEFGIQFE